MVLGGSVCDVWCSCLCAQAAPLNLLDPNSKVQLIAVTSKLLPAAQVIAAATPSAGGGDVASKAPVQGSSLTSAPTSPSPGSTLSGYPFVDVTTKVGALAPGTRHDLFPRLLHKRNVVLIAEESFRYDLANPEFSPQTLAWLQSHARCYRSDVHFAGCHVSELAYFSLLYSVNAYHYNVFSTERVPSYPLQIFRHNGYRMGIVAASLLWAFPNANLIENFHTVDSVGHNGQILERVEVFLKEVTQSGQPFFLYINPHMAKEEAAREVNRSNRTRVWRDLHDRDRMAVLGLLEKYNVVDNSVVVVTSDHGDMKGSDGRNEVGHGQPESSWWQPKVAVPLWMCMPSEAGPNGSGKRSTGDAVTASYVAQRDVSVPYAPPVQPVDLLGHKDSLPPATSHMDVLPTVLTALGLDPPVDPWVFSSGRVLDLRGVGVNGQPVLAPTTPRDYVLFSPRFFPQRDKIIGLATRGTKLWFRVKAYDVATREAAILPERLSDLSDNVLYCATPSVLRAAFSSQLVHGSTVCKAPEGVEGLGADSCERRVAELCPGVVSFLGDLWRFLDPVGV